MEVITMDGYEFIKTGIGGVEVYFSTAKNGLNFNIAFKEGIDNIVNLKNWFRLNRVGYLKQIHSCNVFSFHGDVEEGDALITSELNTAVGVFTADCIPIMIYDEFNKVIAAVHSGWKGTHLEIVRHTLEKMKIDHGTKPEDVFVYIGPHNRGCCYEFGKTEVDRYFNNTMYHGLNIYSNGKLNLEECIKVQLKSVGVKEEKIFSAEICTHCSNEFELYSYRKVNESDGRLFSFIVLRD